MEERAKVLTKMIIDTIGDSNETDMLQIKSLAFAYAGVEYMNDRIQKVPALLSDRVFMSSREKLNSEVQKYSSSLGLNRSQRLKLKKAVEEPKDELLNILG